MKALHEKLVGKINKQSVMAHDVIQQHASLEQQNQLTKQSNSQVKLQQLPKKEQPQIKIDAKNRNQQFDGHLGSENEQIADQIKVDSPKSFINQPSIDDLQKAVNDLNEVSNQLRNSGMLARQSDIVDG